MAPIAHIAMAVLLFSATFVNAAPTATNLDNDAHIAGFSRAVSKAATGVQIVYKCVTPNTMAMTFDDGPFEYFANITELFNLNGAKATFFINGDNYDSIFNYEDELQNAYDAGHQIASHTWSHADLATLSVSQINYEMSELDAAIKSIIGVSPMYMRPPYGSINDLVINTIGTRYTIVMWSLDTNDWQDEDDWTKGYQVYTDNIKKTNNSPGEIVLEHETIQMTAFELAPRAIKYAKSMGWKLVTVAECLGNTNATSWYRA
ncbi:Carbohydrate esterase 4 protein [Mortierella sp. AD031]|nr:Carbohydrate esterase 4 protein [Mortierella sp. AD031]